MTESLRPIDSHAREELEIAGRLLQTLDNPTSLGVHLALQHGCWQEILDHSVNPQSYQNVGDFADAYLASEVLKKSVSLPTGVDRVAVATASFYEAEHRCWETNHRLIAGNHPKWFSRVKHEVRVILGSIGSHLEDLPHLFRLGPGATTALPGRGSTPSRKIDASQHLTHGLVPFVKQLMGERWHDMHRKPFSVVEGNRFTTVPKSAKTDRGICIEPSLNIWYQLGVGAVLRRCLKRVGVDLKNQAAVNRAFAENAEDWGLATLDLKQASDSVAWVLVREMLPREWFHLLDLGRSQKTFIKGEWVELEKFSSMGNGYTFELETILFLAVLRAIVPSSDWCVAHVFGDDLILPQRYAGQVVEALNYLGFEVNGSKSFLAGNFFESCGSDFFQGVDVRPFFLRKSKGNPIPYTLMAANLIRIYAAKNMHGFCDARWKPLWEQLAKAVPSPWGVTVPSHFGMTGLIVSEEEARCRRAADGLEGYAVRHVAVRPVKECRDVMSVPLVWLARRGLVEHPSEDDVFSQGFEPVRGYLRKPRLGRPAISRWSEGLGWAE